MHEKCCVSLVAQNMLRQQFLQDQLRQTVNLNFNPGPDTTPDPKPNHKT